MKAEQVDRALHQKFVGEGERLVFWHDKDGEFADYVAEGLSGDLVTVKVLNVAEQGCLSAKLHLERDDRTGKYLVYTTGDTPPPEEDWLLDIRLYSAEFHADVTSIWLQELGLTELHLRDHLRARSAFLGNQERRLKLKQWIAPGDDEAALDLKMIAVLVGSEVPDPFPVFRALCHQHVRGGEFDLSQTPEAIALLDKMALLDRFWGIMSQQFGYSSNSPSLSGLLRSLVVSDLFHQIGSESIVELAHFVLPDAGRRNAVVCLTNWRDSSAKASSYDAAAAALSKELDVAKHLSGLSLPALKDVFTFWDAEKQVVSALARQVLSDGDTVDVAAVKALATERKAGHWLAGPGSQTPDRLAIADAYDAIVAAAELFELQATHRRRLSFDDPKALLSAYQADLYRFDQCYRLFNTKAKAAHARSWNLLKDLARRVEEVYDQGFLQPFGIEWSRLLDAGFLEQWSADEMPAQTDFYAKQIQPHLDKSDRKRAFVIISDAFRYEAAQELVEALNRIYPLEAKLDAMLGVLPSYTALGMASLLPHKTLRYNSKGDVLADDASTAGIVARGKRLDAVDGMACKAEDLVSKKTEEAREFTRDARVVYIYHNVIDARGDSAPTESETFQAVDDCIRELVALVQFCVNRLNAAKVWVTADHGFLFQQDAPGLTDKTDLAHKPSHAVKVKKRYVIGPNLGSAPEAHHGSIAATAGADGGMEFWVPRGANRFHFTGGARFVHGGAMPQEVVIPLVTVTQLRGKKRTSSRPQKASVQIIGARHKITTPAHRFELIQTEAVSDRRTPITLRVGVYDEMEPVTSIEKVTLDSTSDSIDERKKSVRLELRTGTYDKNKPYRLVLRDAETDAEVQSVPVTIDRSFDDDF
jgi:uncharacterized protein (TIGR02687 family)